MEDEDLVYGECNVCCSAWSGSAFLVQDKADDHELENPDHIVKIKED